MSRQQWLDLDKERKKIQRVINSLELKLEKLLDEINHQEHLLKEVEENLKEVGMLNRLRSDMDERFTEEQRRRTPRGIT